VINLNEANCAAKTTHKSAHAAAESIRRLKKKLTVYRCDVCKFWHVTSKTKGDKFNPRSAR